MIVEMDVNYLLHRQQVSLIQANDAHSAEGRIAYERLARGYTSQIEEYRQKNQTAYTGSH